MLLYFLFGPPRTDNAFWLAGMGSFSVRLCQKIYSWLGRQAPTPLKGTWWHDNEQDTLHAHRAITGTVRSCPLSDSREDMPGGKTGLRVHLSSSSHLIPLNLWPCAEIFKLLSTKAGTCSHSLLWESPHPNPIPLATWWLKHWVLGKGQKGTSLWVQEKGGLYCLEPSDTGMILAFNFGVTASKEPLESWGARN